MKTIRGVIDCKETKSIPNHSVTFIYVIKNEKVIGQQILPRIDQFPFEYQVEVDEASLNDSTDLGIRVMVENGENTLFLNGSGLTEIDGSQLENDIEVNPTAF